MTLNITAGAHTDVGMKRDHNEDYYYRSDLDKNVEKSEGYLFVAADGVGGNRGGGDASRIACEQLPKHFFNTERNDTPLVQRLTDAIHLTHHDIRAVATKNPMLQEMSCTVVILAAVREEAVVAHLGDARIYWLNRADSGSFQQITKDHSWVQEQVDAGLLTPEQAATHRNRNVVTRTLGGSKMHQPEVHPIALAQSDRYLLCSDGLHGPVSHKDLTRWMQQDADLNQIAEQLVTHANQNGGPDNIVAITVQIGEWKILADGSSEETVPTQTVVLPKPDPKPLVDQPISKAKPSHPPPTAIQPQSKAPETKLAEEPQVNQSSAPPQAPVQQTAQSRFGWGLWGISILLFLGVSAVLAWLLLSGEDSEVASNDSLLSNPPTEIAVVVTIPTAVSDSGEAATTIIATSTLAPESTMTATPRPTNTSQPIVVITHTATPLSSLTPSPTIFVVSISAKATQEEPKLELLDIRCDGNHSFEPNAEINFKWIGKASTDLGTNEWMQIAIQPIDPARGIARQITDKGANILPNPENGEWIVPRKLSSFGIVGEGDLNWWVEYVVDDAIVDTSDTGCFRIIPPNNRNNQDEEPPSEPDQQPIITSSFGEGERD